MLELNLKMSFTLQQNEAGKIVSIYANTYLFKVIIPSSQQRYIQLTLSVN